MRFLALLTTLSLATYASAAATVNVSAPKNNSTVTTQVQYVATATTSCSSGVSAMGIYTAPGVLVFTTPGASLNTVITLNPGVYNTVVQEWDNCGGSSTSAITIRVGSSTSGGQVSVTAPKVNSTVSPTVQFTASATTSCSKGVASMGIYSAPGVLVYTTPGAELNTPIELKPGKYNTVVEEWDNCGGAATATVPVTVSGGTYGGVFQDLHQGGGWTGYALLPPGYGICSSCVAAGPQTTWAMTQKISSPSLSGSSTETAIGGKTVYSDVLWNNHLIGDFSSQGLNDTNKTIIPTLHNFTYDVYFYMQNPAVSQAEEFDINQFVDGLSFIWGHECRIAGGNEWDIWDDPSQSWHPTGVPCNPIANSWNHLILQVQRTSNNQLLFESITLNGVTANLNYLENPTPTTWYGVTVNYQQDGNFAQTPYSVWLDNLNFAYF